MFFDRFGDSTIYTKEIVRYVQDIKKAPYQRGIPRQQGADSSMNLLYEQTSAYKQTSDNHLFMHTLNQPAPTIFQHRIPGLVMIANKKEPPLSESPCFKPLLRVSANHILVSQSTD